MFLRCRCRLLFPWFLLLVLVGVAARTAATATSGVSDPPAPQPATPPTFDHSDDQGDQDDGLPADPAPATPPTPDGSQSLWPSSKDSTAGSQTPPEPYNGTEYRFKRFVIRPAQLKLEGLLLVALAAHVLLSYRGQRANARRVRGWWEAHVELLGEEFTQVGAGPKGYLADGPALYYGYATGRRGCQSLMIRFALRPRQDLPFMLYEEARAAIDFTWTGRSDRLELVWQLAPTEGAFEPKQAFVWALVEKRLMNVVRDERWDVRTFTEVKESTLLPSHLVVMSESGELTEQILKSKDIGLLELLQAHPTSLDWFDSLVLSGTPPTEPLLSELPLPAAPAARTLTLRLRLPSASRIGDAAPLVRLCFALIDALDRAVSVSGVAASKLTRRRAEVSGLMLDETRKEAERAREDERRRRLKEAQDDKLAKMSPSEQRKHAERERRRNAAKMSKTVMKRK